MLQSISGGNNIGGSNSIHIYSGNTGLQLFTVTSTYNGDPIALTESAQVWLEIGSKKAFGVHIVRTLPEGSGLNGGIALTVSGYWEEN